MVEYVYIYLDIYSLTCMSQLQLNKRTLNVVFVSESDSEW